MKLVNVIKHKLEYSNTLRDLTVIIPAVIKAGYVIESLNVFHKLLAVVSTIHAL